MLGIVSCKIDNILAKELMARGLCIHAKTIGASMYPLIKTGYKILIEPKCVAELNVGDIVLYQRGENFIVHRLIKKNNSTDVVTRGDNMPRYDVPVTVNNIMGRVTQIENQRRKLKLTGWPSRILARFIALFSRFIFRGQVRLTRALGRLWWFIEGRRIN